MNLYKNGSKYMENKDDEASYNRVKSFFNEEYKLNYLTSTLNTPFITVLNGITMGGGVGLSLHTHYSFATEKTLLAMPETSIGFFPDVGASHLLPRCENEVGMYLALTGDRIRGADVTQLGLAKYFCFTQDYNTFYNRLTDAHETINHTRETIEMINVDHCTLPRLSLTPHLECIERCFSKGSVEEIVEALKQETKDVEFAKKTLATLERVSPLSLKVTYEQMRRGKFMDLDEALKMEYRIALNMINNPDFYTGVKSVLVDKVRDVRPNWRHDSIKAVDDATVAKFFDVPAGEKDLDLFNVAVFRGSGWKTIQRFPFEENVTEEPLINAHPYPMFDLIPAQKYPTEVVQSAVWAHSRDMFHTHYWNYLLRFDDHRFNFTMENLKEEIEFVDDYLETVAGEETLIDGDVYQNLDAWFSHDKDLDMYTTVDELPRAMNMGIGQLWRDNKERRRLMRMKEELIEVQNEPENPDRLTPDAFKAAIADLDARIDALTSKNPKKSSDGAILYNASVNALNKIRDEHPLAVAFIEAADLPNIPTINRTYPDYVNESVPDDIVAILTDPVELASYKADLKAYYIKLAELLKVPAEGLASLVRLDMGDFLAESLQLFNDEDSFKINPKTNKPYGALADHWLAELEKMDIDAILDRLLTFGLDTNSLSVTNGRRDLAFQLERMRYEEAKKAGKILDIDIEAPQKFLASTSAERAAYVEEHGVFKGDVRAELDVLAEADRILALGTNVTKKDELTDYDIALKGVQAVAEYEETLNRDFTDLRARKTDFTVLPDEVTPASLQHTITHPVLQAEIPEELPPWVDRENLIKTLSGKPEDVHEFINYKAPLLTKLDLASQSLLRKDSVMKWSPSTEWIYDEVHIKPRFADYDERTFITREFLWYLGLNFEAINNIYPGFDYFLACPYTDPQAGANPEINHDNAEMFRDHPDHFKINFSDYARPMIPPKLLAAVKAKTKQVYWDEYIGQSGLTKVHTHHK